MCLRFPRCCCRFKVCRGVWNCRAGSCSLLAVFCAKSSEGSWFLRCQRVLGLLGVAGAAAEPRPCSLLVFVCFTIANVKGTSQFQQRIYVRKGRLGLAGARRSAGCLSGAAGWLADLLGCLLGVARLDGRKDGGRKVGAADATDV